MRPISALLSRYASIAAPHAAVRAAVVNAIREVAGVAVAESAVSVRGETAFVTASAALKSEIYLRHEAIVRAVRKFLGSSSRRVVRAVR
jgi:hypothetical protein